MSFFGDMRCTPAATNPPVTAAANPPVTASASQFSGGVDPRVALTSLSEVQSRMDSLHRFLSDSVNANAQLGQPQIDVVSSEISAAIHQIIASGAALLSCNPSLSSTCPEAPAVDPKSETQMEYGFDDYDIVEMDAVELLAEHVHFCEICGKGFKRDANLRMHMRAHGNQFKTRAALAKPENGAVSVSRERTRFSCPYLGCNRNKGHKKFRPLKSAICVKNHFKRSHCPKMYSCNRCNKKSFSVVADLKSHLRHCGENKWRCSCGTSFTRKDKLFGHMELFEGHMPAVVAAAVVEKEKEKEEEVVNMKCAVENKDDGFFDGLLDEFCMVDDYCFQDAMNNRCSNSLDNGMEGFFEF